MPAFLFKRWWTRAAIIGAMLATLAGCSALQLGYNQLPNLAWWWLNGYLDFPSESAGQVKDRLRDWLAWHRSTQLQDYVGLLARAQQQVLQPATTAQACQWEEELRARIEPALERALPLAAEVLPTITPTQLRYLERQYRSKNEEFRADFLQGDEDERLQASLKRSVERAEWLYGKLEAPQRQLLTEAMRASPFDAQAWLAERQWRQAQMLQLLRRHGAQSPGQADRDAALRALRQLAQQTLRSPNPAYRAYQQRLSEFNCELAARLHNSTTAAQRLAAQKRIRGWESDLRSLAAQAAPAVAGALNPPAAR